MFCDLGTLSKQPANDLGILSKQKATDIGNIIRQKNVYILITEDEYF